MDFEIEYIFDHNDPEFANIDGKGIEFFQKHAGDDGGCSLAQYAEGKKGAEMNEHQVREQKRREDYQRELFERPETACMPKQQQEGVPGHGLSELCMVRTRTGIEKVLRFTEAFLPTKSDEKVRQMMACFNRVKMPLLKNLGQHEYQERKRELKAQLKEAQERADRLKQRIASGLFEPPVSGYEFLVHERLNLNQLNLLKHEKRMRQPKLQILESLRPKRHAEPISIIEMAKRKRPRVQEESKDITMQNQDLHPNMQLEVNQKKLNDGLQLISVNQQSSIMQKVEMNLQSIQSCLQKPASSFDKDSILFLNQKLQKIRLEQTQVPENQTSSVISRLNVNEKTTLKQIFGQNHYKRMNQCYPGGVFNLTETEKQCFDFINNLKVENGFYTVQGQVSRPKASILPDSLGNIMGQLKGGLQKVKESNTALRDSMFEGFIDSNDQVAQAADDAEEYCVMSQSESEEGQNDILWDDGELKSKAAKERPKSKQSQAKDEVQMDLMDQDYCQNTKPGNTASTLASWFYKQGERDHRIRAIMNAKRFELLKEANINAGLTRAQKAGIQRKKFWGELKDMDSQMQIDKDYVHFQHTSAHLPKHLPRVVFEFEQGNNQESEPLKTKYGSLSLSGALSHTNFKIDDLEEYEFVQRQRAYLYDPHHIKGSSQFKNFCTQVGTGSLGNKQQPSIMQDTSQVSLLELTPSLQIVLGMKQQQDQRLAIMDEPGKQNKKQMPQKSNQDLVLNLNDNFDKLTDVQRWKRLEEYVRRKKNEEITKNQANDKKIQSTAYRPTSLPVAQHVIRQSQDSKEEAQANGDAYFSDGDEVMKSTTLPQEVQTLRKDGQKGGDQEMHGSEGSEDEGQAADVLDSNLTQEASHAKCILDLSFNKFKWNINDDFRRFHRPDIQQCFDSEREVRKSIQEHKNMLLDEKPSKKNRHSITIDSSGNLKKSQTSILDVSVPVTVVDRDFVKRKNKKRGIINADEFFKDRFKLSLKEGTFCLFEHIDENPIYLNNFGMVSKLFRYVYSDKRLPNDSFVPKPHTRQEESRARLQHMGPYGLQIPTNENSKLPLLGNIDTTEFQGVSILSNKMYKAPVFYHKPRRTDFFCSVYQDKKGGRRIILREIQDIYSVGQLEPILPVYNPQSRCYQQFIKQHSKAYIVRFLQENNNRLDFREIQHLFSYLTDQMLKKFMKDISVEVNRDQICSSTGQLSEETKKNLITPEMICQYESALYGEAMLRKRGIENITNADKISYASNKYSSEQRDAIRQKIAKFIENEVLCTPWNLSQNFVTINQSGGMLMLRGVGDPSNGHGGYSFLKMPLKISNDSLKDSMKIRRDLNPAIQNPKSVTGTDADLRRLKKADIYDRLVQLGYDSAVLGTLPRWGLVGQLREHSSLRGGVQGDDKNQKYARGIRYTSQIQRVVYHEQVNKCFKNQMRYLAGKHEVWKKLGDYSDHEDPADNLDIPAKNLRDKSQGQKGFNPDFEGGVFPGSNHNKYVVEITDNDQIHKLIGKDPQDQVQIGGTYIQPDNMPTCGTIKHLRDIPNFERLLLPYLPLQSQAQQSGQVGLMNIGGNSGNQQVNMNNPKNAENLVREELESGGMTYKCRVVKKIIKNEDDVDQIERIEFNSDPKVVKKFEKRHQKCKTKNNRARKTGLREKMLQNQQITENKNAFKTPYPVAKEGTDIQEEDWNEDQPDNGNVIKISMDDTEEAARAAKHAKAKSNKNGKQIMDLKKLVGQPSIDQLLQGADTNTIGTSNFFKSAQSLRPGSKHSASLIRSGKAQFNTKSAMARQTQESNDKIVIITDGYDEPQADQFADFSYNNIISLDMNMKPVPDSNKIVLDLPMESYEMQDQMYDDIGDDDSYFPNEGDQSRKSKKKQDRNDKKKMGKPSKAESRQNQRFMESYLQDMEQQKRQNQMLSTSRRSKLSGESILNTAVSTIIKNLYQHDPKNIFRYPVDKKLALGYYQAIQKPICLEDMNSKAKRQEYSSLDQFLGDVELMKRNSIQFNGPLNPISQLAENIEIECHRSLEDPEIKVQLEEAAQKLQGNSKIRFY